MKIAFATPFYEQKAWTDYVSSILQSVQILHELDIPWTFLHLAGDSYVDRARNTLVADFLNSDATHLFFIDSDMGWTPFTFMNLIGAPGEVVGATYPMKNKWEEYPVAIECDENGFPLVDQASGLLTATLLPAGFLRIARSAFEKIEKNEPGNKYLDEKDGGPAGLRHGFFTPIQEGQTIYREDAAFCLRCARAGVKMMLEPRATLNHWGVAPRTGNYHEFLLKQPGGSES
jgi:hypothetical protein